MDDLEFNYTTDKNANYKKFGELKTGDPVYLAIFDNHNREYTIKKLYPQVMTNQEQYEMHVKKYPWTVNKTELDWKNFHWWDNWTFLFFPEYERPQTGPNAEPPYWDAVERVESDATWGDETFDFTEIHDNTHEHPRRSCNICTTLEEAITIIRGEMEVARKNAEDRIHKAQSDLVEIADQEAKLEETIKNV